MGVCAIVEVAVNGVLLKLWKEMPKLFGPDIRIDQTPEFRAYRSCECHRQFVKTGHMSSCGGLYLRTSPVRNFNPGRRAFTSDDLPTPL